MVQATKPQVKTVDIEVLEQRFKDFLYAGKGKVTNERLALLRTLYSHDGHYSVDELLDLMQADHFKVSRATVYRTVDLLVQSGLVRKLVLMDQETRYESALTTGHHDHMVCLDCHRITEFFNPQLEQIQDEILEQNNMEPVKHIHQLYGRCTLTDCPGKKSAPNKSSR